MKEKKHNQSRIMNIIFGVVIIFLLYKTFEGKYHLSSDDLDYTIARTTGYSGRGGMESYIDYVYFVDPITEGLASGYVSLKDFGNTQTGNMQISTFRTFSEYAGATDCDCGAGAASNHELGHIFNIYHNEEFKGHRVSGNLMNTSPPRGILGKPGAKERVTTPEQRDTMLEHIPELGQ